MNEGLLDLTVRQLFEQNGAPVIVAEAVPGGEPAGAVLIVIGSEETSDIIEAVNRQLEIWKKVKTFPRYVDERDRVISIAAVRNLQSTYYAFARDMISGELSMLKGKGLPAGCDTFAEAQEILDAYADKKGWSTVPSPQVVEQDLARVMDVPPGFDRIASWSDLDRVYASQWARQTLLRSTEGRSVRVPPVPSVLFEFAAKLSRGEAA